MWELCTVLDLDLLTVQQTVTQIYSNFLWSIFFSTIEIDVEMLKSGTTNRRRVVSLQRLEHFDVISMVDKSINH